jgi:hypothetical protein
MMALIRSSYGKSMRNLGRTRGDLETSRLMVKAQVRGQA